MSLSAGTRLGPYEIVSAIGAGGMGEVYRARDTRLKREVALKILPESFAADPDRLARFQREAEVLASLNHPHIAAIYGIEESGGTHALVMELVEGEDLSQRIARGPIPIDEALPIARQISEALEAAHEQGIIHRDLKPANIKVRLDGTAKVLDFGLAKALEPAGAPSPNVSMSPTITSPAMITGVGMLLGTAAYLSPEQARGKTVDKRTDIWAFGCVLYEMLTGRQAFETRDTVSDAVAAILTRNPDWNALPDRVPSSMSRLLRRCLQKDPDRRLHHIADARVELEDALSEPPAPAPLAATGRPEASTSWKRAVPWAITALALGIAAVWAFWSESQLPASATQSVLRFEVNLPTGVELFNGTSRAIAISPDGTRLAFVGVLGGSRQVYIRSLGQFEAVPVRGTDAVSSCFFSPDGQSIGLITSPGEVKTVSLGSGLTTTVTSGANFLYGAAWTADDHIVFVRAGTLWRVPSSGGTAESLTTLGGPGGDTLHSWPVALPDGKTILFTAASGGQSRIDALVLATGQRRTVVERGTLPLYAASGHLVFFRDDGLFAAPFDAASLTLTGAAVRTIDNFPMGVSGVPIVDVSASGTVVFSPMTAASRLVWVSRQGAEEPLDDALRPYANPRLAQSGNRVVVDAGALWVHDLTRATFTRLASREDVLFAIWAPDSRRILYRTPNGLRFQDADGGGEGQLIHGTSQLDFPGSITPDGETLVFIRSSEETSFDIYAMSLRDPGTLLPIVKTPAYEGGARLSPDGRWLTYVSNESGRNEIYLRPFPGPERRWQISSEGGTQPIWNPNGREIFYRNGNKMMDVVVGTAPEVTLSTPRLLFEQQYAFGSGITIANYDIASDGQRFVMVKDESNAGRLHVVQNWLEELKGRVSSK